MSLSAKVARPTWVLACCLGCHTGSPASAQECTAPLAGVWQVEGSPQRWALLERGTTIEAYPLFDDSGGASDSQRVVSPRRVTAVLGKTALLGRIERWVMRGAEHCAVRAAVRIECRGDTLQFDLPALAPPTDFTTCQSSAAVAAQRWRRAPRW